MRKSILLALGLAVSLAVHSPLAQEAGSTDSFGFIVTEVSVLIEGMTRPGALKDYLDIHEGRRFDSRLELEYYLQEKERLLRDNRVFDTESTIGFEILGPGDPAPVRVVASVRDTWTILAVPFPKFSVENGASLALRYKDFNFVGSLVPLTLNLDHYFVLQRTTLGASFGLSPRFLGAEWDLAFDGALRSSAGGTIDADRASASAAGEYSLGSLEKRWSLQPYATYTYELGTTPPTLNAGVRGIRRFGGRQDWTLALGTGYRGIAQGEVENAWTNEASLGIAIPLARLESKATLEAKPIILASMAVDLEGGGLLDPYAGVKIQVGYGAVDWVGNFRSGSSISFYAEHLEYWNETDPALCRDHALFFQAQGFASLGNAAGINARLTARWDLGWSIFGTTWDPTALDWAEYLRGVSGDLYGDIGAALNLEFPINFAQGRFFTLNVLEAEIFVAPFVDLGFLRQDPGETMDLLSQAFAAAGAEVVLFPRHARSFVYRLSLGYDFLPMALGAAFDPSGIEGWLGLGLFF